MSLHRGGLDIQAERTFEELMTHDSTYQYEFFDWRIHEPADAYHFFGIPPHLWEIVLALQELRKPYLITLLSGSRQTFFNSWIRDRAKRLLGLHCNSKILDGAAAVVMLIEKERELLSRTFAIPRGKTVIIPNFVDDVFFDATSKIWREVRDDKPFLLCVGMIQDRKNQLLLARAANATQLPLVLIGPAILGEAEYARKVAIEMKDNERFGGAWIKGLEQTDPLLISAHSACRAFVLLSKAETQPLSVMQAMAAKRPLLLGKSYYSGCQPFADLPQVELNDFDAVCRALREAWDAGKPATLSEAHRPKMIVREIVNLYRTIINPET